MFLFFSTPLRWTLKKKGWKIIAAVFHCARGVRVPSVLSWIWSYQTKVKNHWSVVATRPQLFFLTLSFSSLSQIKFAKWFFRFFYKIITSISDIWVFLTPCLHFCLFLHIDFRKWFDIIRNHPSRLYTVVFYIFILTIRFDFFYSEQDGRTRRNHVRGKGLNRRLRHQVPYDYNVEPAIMPEKAPLGESSTCPGGYFLAERTCFQLSEYELNWIQAVQGCRRAGGKLAVLEDHEAIRALKKHLERSHDGEYDR